MLEVTKAGSAVVRACKVYTLLAMVGLTMPAAGFSTRVTGVLGPTMVFDITSTLRVPGLVNASIALTELTVALDAVIDAGTKSFFSDKSAAFGSYGVIKGMPDVVLERAYEEHGVLNLESSKNKLKVCDKLEIIPNHVCPAVNLFDKLMGIRNDSVEVVWNVAARGKLQ